MRIRTITTGVDFGRSIDYKMLELSNDFNQEASKIFTDNGYDVETVRLSTNPFEEYTTDPQSDDFLYFFEKLSNFCDENLIKFMSIGEISNPEYAKKIADVLKINEAFSASIKIGDVKSGFHRENLALAAKTIKRLSQETPEGLGNFQFCASANCKPGIPFYPAGYHRGESTFSIGLECSDHVYQAFEKAKDFWKAEEVLREKLNELFVPIEKIALEISENLGVKYAGIDTSTAPGIEASEALPFAYEKLGLGTFGGHGTLTISSIITKVIKNLDVKTCGYSGLMLPVLEDYGLAKRANDQTYNLQNLLLYSTVCGCGYDTVPIPGNTPEKKIENMLLDVATLAIKLDKQLAARIFPVSGKIAGDMTNFDSPYLVNCRIFDVQ